MKFLPSGVARCYHDFMDNIVDRCPGRRIGVIDPVRNYRSSNYRYPDVG